MISYSVAIPSCYPVAEGFYSAAGLEHLPSDDFFFFDVPQGAASIVGRVRRPLTDLEVTQVCECMLAAARSEKEQFWLLDIRQDPKYKTTALTHWLSEEFFPRTLRVLGQALYLAYLLDTNTFAQVLGRDMDDDWHMITPRCRISFFTQEADALAWLANVRQASNKGGRGR